MFTSPTMFLEFYLLCMQLHMLAHRGHKSTKDYSLGAEKGLFVTRM